MAKTDNHNLPAKLDLRRYFLRKYHSDKPPAVLDCCQGSGMIWAKLRQEFEVASYWGVDVKPKPGRLKIDSARILAQPGWTQDVIDVDAYASPWKHWAAIQANGQFPLTVFLTRGSHTFETLNAFEKAALGITFQREIPGTFWPKLQLMDMAIRYCVARTCDGIIIREAVEAVSDGNARYIGVRLEREQPVVTPAAAKHTKATKEPSHV